MARVEVHNVCMDGDRIESLTVKFHNLEERTIDRATAIRWMLDGHSFIPVGAENDGPALSLIEVAGDWFIRSDNAVEEADVIC